MLSINRLLPIKVIFLLSLIVFSCSSTKSELEKIELVQLDGARINWADYKNKVVFINFWATWCKPCIQEMPTIAKAKQQLNEQDVAFLFPSNESTDLIQNFKEKKGFDFDFVQVQNMEDLNIIALPTTYIFNQRGELVFSEAGFRDWSTPENMALITGNSDKP